MEDTGEKTPAERHPRASIAAPADHPRIGLRRKPGEFRKRRGKIDVAHQHPRALRGESPPLHGESFSAIVVIAQNRHAGGDSSEIERNLRAVVDENRLDKLEST